MSLRTIIIVSSFYIEPMSKPLAHLLNYIPNTENFQFIYNQIHQELISKSSCFNKNKDSLNIIIVRLSDLVDWDGCRYNDKILASNIYELLSNVVNIVKTFSYPLTVFVCPENTDIHKIKSFQSSRNAFLKNLRSLSNLRVVTEKEIADCYFVPVIHDDIAEKQGHIPYTTEYFAAISLMLARTLLWNGSKNRQNHRRGALEF